MQMFHNKLFSEEWWQGLPSINKVQQNSVVTEVQFAYLVSLGVGQQRYFSYDYNCSPKITHCTLKERQRCTGESMGRSLPRSVCVYCSLDTYVS